MKNNLGMVLMALVLLSDNKIMSAKRNIYLLKGKSARLSCLKGASGRVEWHKESESGQELLSTNKYYAIKKGGFTLTIKQVAEKIVGVYTCNSVSTNGRPGEVIKTFNLTIKVNKPPLTFARYEIPGKVLVETQPEGGKAEFDCTVVNGSGPVQYIWYRIGRHLFKTLYSAKGPKLVIEDMGFDDGGKYKCRVENENKERIERQFQLCVKSILRAAPMLAQHDFANQTTSAGSTVMLTCYDLLTNNMTHFRFLKWKTGSNRNLLQLLGDGVARQSKEFYEMDEINMTKVTYPMNDVKRLYGASLTLKKVTVADTGFYTCLASNHIGNDYITMYLKVFKRD